MMKKKPRKKDQQIQNLINKWASFKRPIMTSIIGTSSEKAEELPKGD